MDFIPKGIIVALVTPLTDEYKINESGLRKLINYVIDGGVHGIFVSGTAGEFWAFKPEEKREIIQIALDETKGRVPVYAGAGGITTRECVLLANIAEDCGVDAVSILTPMFISPTQEELITHYKTIAENTALPVILYNNVPKTGVTLTAATVEKLAEVNNIVGIKDSSGDFTLTEEYIRRTKGKQFHVLIGRDTQIHACLCYGGSGAIAACANIAPKICVDIYEKYISGDAKGSLEAQYLLAPLRMAFNLGTHPAMLKKALEMIGIEAGPCVTPVGPMGVEEEKQLKRVLIQMKLVK